MESVSNVELKKKLEDKIVEKFGRKFCCACQHDRPIDGGKIKVIRGTKRFVCGGCCARLDALRPGPAKKKARAR